MKQRAVGAANDPDSHYDPDWMADQKSGPESGTGLNIGSGDLQCVGCDGPRESEGAGFPHHARQPV